MIEQIDEALKTAKGKYRERLLAIRAHIRGYGVTEIAQLYGKTRKTIYNWLNRFGLGGFHGLIDRKPSGRPATIDCSSTDPNSRADQLRSALRDRPSRHGFFTEAWTSKLLREYLMRRYGINVSVVTSFRIIRRLGFSMQRPGLILKGGNPRARDAYRVALHIVREGLRPDAILLFGDEAGFNIAPTITKMWSPRGKQPHLAATGTKSHVSVIGAIDPRSNFSHFELATRVNSNVFGRFLRTLHDGLRNTGYRVAYLVLDNVSFHKSRQVRDLARSFENPRIQIVFQPPYSPDLNPIERLWKHIRKYYTHNRVFDENSSALWVC